MKRLACLLALLLALSPASAQLSMTGVGGGFGGSSVTTVVWNSGDQIGVTVSGGGLLATYNDTGSRGGIRANVSFGTGQKLYFEAQYTFSGANNMGVGWSSASKNFATTFLGGDTLSVGAYRDGSVYFNAGSITSWVTTAATGDWVGWAIDTVNNKIWVINLTQGTGWNNGSIGTQNPATNTGGASIAGLTGLPWFPACAFDAVGTGTYSVLANFGATTFQATAPSGFVAVQH